jgi:RNA polymerase sigma factor (TIGR02999 family)
MAPNVDTLELLRARRAGNEAVVDDLFDVLYHELKAIARHRLRQFRPGETLNTTALVHEAYLRLIDQRKAEPNDRTHFLALASRAMRFVLVDHARAMSTAKRGGNAAHVDLGEIGSPANDRADDLIQLNDALEKLALLDRRLADVVDYRFFGGIDYEEIAVLTGRSVPTVKRDWLRARAWLHRAMNPSGDA